LPHGLRVRVPPRPPPMTAKILIVDDNDKIIGSKNRDELDYTKDTYRSTCLWLKNSKGQVLIAQRSLTKDKDPGKWGPAVAGTVDEGETYDSNIEKEIKEEIGLTGLGIKQVAKFKADYPRKQFVIVFGVVKDVPLSELTLQSSEVEGVKWVDHKQLEEDITQNPNKYVSSMSKLLEIVSTNF
jgi:isopentenyl-diphosphate delta-isomerase